MLLFQVTDANDNPPIFSQMVYEASINEESPPGRSVLTVQAFDIDTPKVQSPLSYKLDYTGQKYFRIDSYTGVLYTGDTKLDREKIPFLFFTVFVSDGKNTGEAGVKITLLDINDNAPFFPVPPYFGLVKENSPAGTNVMIIQAVDQDDPQAGGNTIIEYSLVDNSNNQFAIDKNTGAITTLVKFDREGRNSNYSVVVRAADKGTPSLASTVNVTVIIYDVNDHKPKFTSRFFYGTVPEDAEPGRFVTLLTATDEDDGVNAEFEFVIVDGNKPYSFYLNSITGEILVSGLLDYDIKRTYNLTVLVRDRGMPPLTGDEPAYVIITITDANNHPPVFNLSNYYVEVKEDVAVGYQVVVVKIKDVDLRNTTQVLRYDIVQGNDEGYFGIKSKTMVSYEATIITRSRLDRESTSQYTLLVKVTDEFEQFATCTVFITVTDVNDNGPVFQPSYYVATITENVDTEQLVTTIKAVDPDSSSNGLPFAFSLLNATLSNRFKIKNSTITPSTAQIFSYGVFNREETPSFSLVVRGTDSGKPTMSSTAFVYVDVLDQNDNEPFDGNTTIIVNALDGDFIGGVIGKPYYRDEDFNGDVNSYVITSQSPGSFFTINAANGNIIATKNLPIGTYTLRASITETNTRTGITNNFPKTVYSNVDVVVRNVTSSAVESSVTIRLLDMRKIGYFVGDYYQQVHCALYSKFIL